VNYSSHVIEVRQADEFAKWSRSLRDIRAKARIQIRLARVELCNLGDAKFFDGIGELRIEYGPGYASTSPSAATRSSSCFAAVTNLRRSEISGKPLRWLRSWTDGC